MKLYSNVLCNVKFKMFYRCRKHQCFKIVFAFETCVQNDVAALSTCILLKINCFVFDFQFLIFAKWFGLLHLLHVFPIAEHCALCACFLPHLPHSLCSVDFPSLLGTCVPLSLCDFLCACFLCLLRTACTGRVFSWSFHYSFI